MMTEKKVVMLHDRLPILKERRKKRSNRRLVFFLSFFFLLILTVVYFQSPLSHVQEINVIGNHYVQDDLVIEASGLNSRTSIWDMGNESIEQMKELAEIKEATIKRRFPNKIDIFVEEYERTAYLFSEGKYFPIIETGRFLEALPKEALPVDAPILKNWEQGAEVEELTSELTKLPESITGLISEIYYAPTETDSLRIKLFMNDGREVHSTIDKFAERIVDYPTIASGIDREIKGILHMRLAPYFEQLDVEDEEEKVGEGER